MNTLEIIFFILLSIVFYTYIGYGICLCIYNHRTTKTNQKYPSVNL